MQQVMSFTTMACVQKEAEQGKASVFERLGKVKPAAALNRVSDSAPAANNSRQSSGAAATSSRPVDLLLDRINNKARLGESQYPSDLV